MLLDVFLMDGRALRHLVDQAWEASVKLMFATYGYHHIRKVVNVDHPEQTATPIH